MKTTGLIYNATVTRILTIYLPYLLGDTYLFTRPPAHIFHQMPCAEGFEKETDHLFCLWMAQLALTTFLMMREHLLVVLYLNFYIYDLYL